MVTDEEHATHLDVPHDPLSVEEILRAWSQRRQGCPIVLGAGADGPVWIDLLQDGPHLLVGGTTGSGKSELLQSLVASLALAYSPEELNLMLIDYKGGAAFGTAVDLPHTVGLVTDLDEQLTRRALRSLAAEIRRRERVLGREGHVDHEAHVRAARGSRPELPRLVLIVDEFKMLADELPDFVQGLVRLAAVGRSLGIHLVLATQRPAGAITPDMRANMSLRIALRVRDREDSVDVIDASNAARISDTTPGRAFVRGASGRLVEMQTGRVLGTSTRSCPELTVDVLDPLGRPRLPRLARDDAAHTDLELIVRSCREAARRSGSPPQTPPWLPPLPSTATAASIREQLAPNGAEPSVLLGLCDLPDEQSQEPVRWRLAQDGHLGVAGAPRSGRSTVVMRVLDDLQRRTDPTDVHIHLVESRPTLVSGTHLGVRVARDEPDRIRRLLAALARELDSRAARLAAQGHRDVAACRAAHPPGHPDRLPWLVLVIDGWESVLEALDDTGLGDDHDILVGLLRDGAAMGLRAVVTGDRGVLTGRLADVLGERYVLRLGDPHDVALAGLSPSDVPSSQPPGRAVRTSDAAEVQFFLSEPCTSPATGGPAPPDRLRIDPLPPVVDRHDPRLDTPNLLPLGLGGDHLAAIGPILGDGVELLIIGPPRSGRSTVLKHVASRLAALGRSCLLVSGAASVPDDTDQPDDRSDAGLMERVDPRHVERLREILRRGVDVLVDDVERLAGSPAEDLLLAHLDEGHGRDRVFVAAAETSACAGAFRGLAVEVARAGTGLILSPSAAADGELLRVTVPRGIPRSPGRAIYVDRGHQTPVRVARA